MKINAVCINDDSFSLLLSQLPLEGFAIFTEKRLTYSHSSPELAGVTHMSKGFTITSLTKGSIVTLSIHSGVCLKR